MYPRVGEKYQHPDYKEIVITSIDPLKSMIYYTFTRGNMPWQCNLTVFRIAFTRID